MVAFAEAVAKNIQTIIKQNSSVLRNLSLCGPALNLCSSCLDVGGAINICLMKNKDINKYSLFVFTVGRNTSCYLIVQL